MYKHVLYITFDGLSDPLGQSQIIPYLSGIAANGYRISILSCEKETRFKQESASIKKKFEGLQIQWQYIPYSESGNFISRWLYLRKLLSMAKTVCKQDKPQLTHCRSYLAALIGLRLKRNHKIPFLFDMRGFWADERIDGGIWQLSNPVHNLLYHYFKRKEKQFFLESNAMISLTHSGLEDIAKRFGKNISEKAFVIPCCTNPSDFDPSITVPAKIEEIEQNDQVFVYSGSIGTWYCTREMIACVMSWRSAIPQLKLLILTRDKEAVEKITNDLPVEQKNRIVTRAARFAEIPSYLKLAKASIFFIKPAYSKIASSPTKMAESWSMNLPIITNSGIGDNDLYFTQNKAGVLIAEFTDEAYRNGLSAYLDLIQPPHNFRSIALENFDNRKAVQIYLNAYRKIAG